MNMTHTDADTCTTCGAWATAISITGSDNYCPDHTPTTGATPL